MIVPVKTYLKVWAALLGLLALTIGVSFLQLGRLNLPIAMLIAVAKASLIVLVFMHIKGGSRLLHLAAADRPALACHYVRPDHERLFHARRGRVADEINWPADRKAGESLADENIV